MPTGKFSLADAKPIGQFSLNEAATDAAPPSADTGPVGSSGARFVAGAASNLNPLAVLKAAAHPVDTLGNLIDAHLEQFQKAKDLYKEGRYTEAAGHLGAAALPVFGPAAAAAGEKIAEGEDIAGGLGEGAGLIGSVFTPRVVPKAARAVSKGARAVAESPAVRAAVPAIVKHGSTVAGTALGASVGGHFGAGAGAIMGASVGEELAAKLKGAPEAAPRMVMPPKPAVPMEAPLDLTRRLKAENQALHAASEAPTAPEAQTPTPAPVVESRPSGAEIDLTESVNRLGESQPRRYQVSSAGGQPILNERSAGELTPVPKAKLLDPDYAKSPQRMRNELGIQARRLGVKLTQDQLETGVEAIKQGARPDAVARSLAPADPAAELAARLGTPTVEEMTRRVAERNRTGQWERPKATLKAQREAAADVATENRYQELLKRIGGTGR